MNESLDEVVIESTNQNVEYVGFWPRFGALLIDGLIMVPVFLILSMFVKSYEGYMIVQILFLLVVAAYKPFMEFKYGATVGKMAVNAKVVNDQYKSLTVRDAILRSIFNLAQQFVGLIFLFLFFSEGILPRGAYDFNNMRPLSDLELIQAIINGLFGIIVIVELIVMLTDEKFRSLHDKIAKTYVIKDNRR